MFLDFQVLCFIAKSQYFQALDNSNPEFNDILELFFLLVLALQIDIFGFGIFGLFFVREQLGKCFQ